VLPTDSNKEGRMTIRLSASLKAGITMVNAGFSFIQLNIPGFNFQSLLTITGQDFGGWLKS
jgi:hypothetical protein